MSGVDLTDRSAFLERLRLQLQARYRDVRIVAEPERFGLRLSGDGIDARIPLTPLHQAVLREPDRAGGLIAQFVTRTASELTPSAPMELSLGRVLWCVRTTDYLADHSREGDLLSRPVAGDLVRFIAEELPNSIMRGVPRQDWGGTDDDEVTAAADRNTVAKFTRLPGRIRDADRVPRDGWSFSGDPLFQGSMLLVPAVLEALVARAGGDVLLATPDRGQVLAVPAEGTAAAEFPRRVVRTWREALNACSRDVLRTDGAALDALPRHGDERSGGLLRRLRG